MLRIHGVSAPSGIRGLQMGRWDDRLDQENDREGCGEGTEDEKGNRTGVSRRIASAAVDRSDILTAKIVNLSVGAHDSVVLGGGKSKRTLCAEHNYIPR